jgi:hypothetical protein
MTYSRILLIWMALWSTSVLAQRAIPDNNLAYPVWINLTNCTGNIVSIQGSGFFLDTGAKLYLVTARHILYTQPQPANPPTPARGPELQCKVAELRSYSKDPSEVQQNRMILSLEILASTGKVKPHASHDVAVVELGTTEQLPAPTATTPSVPASPPIPGTVSQAGILRYNPGIAGIQNAPSGLLDVSMDTVRKFDQVLTANEIYVFGYPASIGLQQAPQIDYNAPLLRKGIVSGLNSANKTIVLDALTFHGNSGGPVLEVTHEGFVTHFFIIGVVSQYVPVAETWINTAQGYGNVQIYNSGYSIAEPMDPVLELIGQ